MANKNSWFIEETFARTKLRTDTHGSFRRRKTQGPRHRETYATKAYPGSVLAETLRLATMWATSKLDRRNIAKIASVSCHMSREGHGG
jgi:hypothetical protein